MGRDLSGQSNHWSRSGELVVRSCVLVFVSSAQLRNCGIFLNTSLQHASILVRR